MAGYRRFVIYLYWCQKEKVQNVGFAKIELQNSQCRIEMHLKGLPQGELALPVYLFSRDENSAVEPVLWGVELGKIEIKRGIGKFGRIFPIEKIGGSRFHYQDMDGMLIPLNTEEMIAGQWDNKDIIRQQFRVWSPDTESEKQKIALSGETVNQTPELTATEPPETENTVPETEDTVPETENAVPETEDTVLATEDTVSATENAVPATEPSATEPSATEPTATEPTTTGRFEQAAARYSAPLAEAFLKEGNASAEKTPLMPEASLAKEGKPAETNDMLHTQQLAYDYEEKVSKKITKRSFIQETASDWEQMWHILSSRREAFAPMEGKDILAVKIDLKDLHLLPEDLWNLGNNSFLLHGFFNYRFLLYGRIHQENGSPYYFIGIPGVFSNQEKVLAAIFGFPEFYLEKKAEIQTGKSGYWCKLLMSSDNNAYK